MAGIAQASHNPSPLSDPIPGAIPTGPFTLELSDIASTFVFPTYVKASPDGTGRLFVAERTGIIKLIKNGAVLGVPFLDISSTSVSTNGGVLSSIAFHPDFSVANSPGEGLLYTVSQEVPGAGVADFGSSSTVKHQSVVYEWKASTSNPDVVDMVSRREILRIDEESAAHNINDLAFGPDGYLYISKGDDDMDTSGTQDGTTIHGSILRIDVDNASGGGGYSVPADNPFVAAGDPRIDEIYAYGFRNPWRISFHPMTGDLLGSDIGEDDIEEINIVESGNYYGWIDKEGSFAFLGINQGVTDDMGDLPPGFNGIDPHAEYDHTEGDRSITGGLIYRGSLFPEMIGHYVFGDLISGRLMHVDPVTGDIQEISIDSNGTQITSGIIGFGETEAREILLVITELNFNPTGRVLSLVGGTAEDVDTDEDGLLNSVDTDDDNDGLVDIDEIATGTNPILFDTDGDGFGDGMEDASGHNPLSSDEYPVWGDINNDKNVDVADVLMATRAATGAATLNDGQLARCNVAPLVAGTPETLFNDDCNVADLYLIQAKALGVINF
ncbi:MAG: hypothetical protein GQ537_04445 [Gammaproteobacteria bacterium]|nr:hypothetical protein [Gammaproteobacteria bacterium]